MVQRVVVVGFLAFFGISAGMPGICAAQSNANTSLSVTIQIVQATAVTAFDGMLFENFTIADGLRQSTHSKQDSGFLTINGQPRSRISVSIPPMVVLHSAAGRPIALSSDITVWSSGDSVRGRKRSFPSTTGGTASFGSNGLLRFHLGGSLHTDYTSAGSYSGKYVITLTY